MDTKKTQNVLKSLFLFLYCLYYNLKVYAVAFRSLIDEIQYKLGFKKTFDIDKDLKKSLEGKVAIVTGGTRGLGLTVVRKLVAKGCYVYIASSQTKTRWEDISCQVLAELPPIDSASGIKRGTIKIGHLDLSSLISVEKFVKSFRDLKLDLNYLICNAGIMFAPKSMTVDGFESHFAVNYLGHCLLTLELLPLMLKTAEKTGESSRIVNVSSSTHRVSKFDFEDLYKKKRYSPAQAYGQSKLAQIMFSSKLSNVLEQTHPKKIQVFCLHPGVILSELYEHVTVIKIFPFTIPLIKLVTRNMVQGAETTLYATLSHEINNKTGIYLEDCHPKSPSTAARNVKDQDRIWSLTFKLLGKWLSWMSDHQTKLFVIDTERNQ